MKSLAVYNHLPKNGILQKNDGKGNHIPGKTVDDYTFSFPTQKRQAKRTNQAAFIP
ncbi:MAG: hypothetical protein H6557_35260 [Lewinellaceae bacterium]|nr:hypothetical protein [Phaeodactylibacter sp.]MCB9041904.1 hypothetical protein [Lewinellaceae bacterium]